MMPIGPDWSHIQITMTLTKSRSCTTSRTHLKHGIEHEERLTFQRNIGLLLSIERGEDDGQTKQQMLFPKDLFVICARSQETKKSTNLGLEFNGFAISGIDRCSK